MDEQQILQLISNAANSMGQSGAAAQQLSSALQMLVRNTSNQTNAASVSRDILQELNLRSANLEKGFRSIAGTAAGLTQSLTIVSSSIYGADKAFTSVIPTLDFLNSTFNKVVTAFGLLGSGIQIAGFSFGRATEAIAAFASTAMDIITNLARFQLETSQKMADAAVDVAKFGASFGGSISVLVGELAKTGIPLQMYSRMVANNADELSKMGIGMRAAGLKVANFTREILQTDDRIVALYGSFDEAAKAVAAYQALQTQLGDVQNKNADQARRDTNEYLIRMREISSITGKQAETLKKEEEGRRKQLDYNLKLGRLGEEARKNVTEGMSVAGKLFGDAGSKYAEEYFATGGKIFSKEAIAYQAMNQEAADAIGKMFDPNLINQSREGYRQSYSSMLEQARPGLEAFAKSMEELAENNRAANHPIIRSMTETATSILANLVSLGKIVEQVNKLEENRTNQFAVTEEDRKRIVNGVEVTVKEAVVRSLDPAVTGFSVATRELLNTQSLLDNNVLKNMSNMSELIGFLNKATQGIISTQQSTIDAIRSISTASIDDLKKTTIELAKSVFENIGFEKLFSQGLRISNFQDLVDILNNLKNLPTPPTGAPATPTPLAPEAPPTNTPVRAEGGIARGPTIAGESGTEAVIPLDKGPIPLQIDLTPLIQILQQNNSLTREMLDALGDMTDVQERILNASY